MNTTRIKIKRIVFYLFTGGLVGLSFFSWSLESNENGSEKIFYTLTIDDKGFEYFHVSIKIENVDSESIILRMPLWSPGAYRLREYPKNVRNVCAYDKTGKELTVEKISEDGYRIESSGNYVLLEYDVKFTFDFWSGNNLDSTYALVQGSSVFMYVAGKKSLPILVKYVLPEGWAIVSPLKQITESELYYAETYDIFIDAPAQLGYFKKYTFTLQDVPFHLVFDGNTKFAADRFLDMVHDICEYQIDLFGEIPFESYIFFYKLLHGRQGGGGLEHLNSTTIGLSSLRLAKDVTTAAEVTAHEFFHVWNVKRIRPKWFGPFDYTKEVRAKALWFCEGVTSYYAALTLVRTNIWSQENFIEELEKQIERLQQTSERHEIGVERASWSIWERGYSYPGLSFYNKGLILGVLIDLAIRHATKNRLSLDDVMRFMNWWFAKEDVGFEPGDIKRAINAISQRDFSEFFNKYVSGTVELPYDKLLAFAGLNVVIKTEWLPYMGNVLFVGPRNRVVTVEANSPVEEAGLKRRDYILDVDGAEVSSSRELREIAKTKKIGSELILKVLRDKVELNLTVEVGKKAKVDCEIKTIEHPTELQLKIRKGWLEGWTSNEIEN